MISLILFPLPHTFWCYLSPFSHYRTLQHNNSCIQRLLADDQSPRAEDIECLCKLLATVGQQLENPSVKGRAGMTHNDVSVIV